MALLNKAWREGEFVPPGSEPGLTLGREWRNTGEERAVEQIAQQRFAYPTADQPALKTFVNIPQRQLGVRSASGDLLYPDIIVMDDRTTEVHLLAEVETVRSLQESPDLPEKWQAFAATGPFYLFVPLSCLDRARKQLKSLRSKPAALRTWRHMAGMNYTDVVEVPL